MAGTSFLIVPFDRNADGKLQPGAPARLFTEDAAEFAAQQVADFHAGIAIIAEPDGEFEEPWLVLTFGRIPVGTLTMLEGETTGSDRGRPVTRLRKLKLRQVGKRSENGRRLASLSSLCWRS
jgi:hypothetical protein